MEELEEIFLAIEVLVEGVLAVAAVDQSGLLANK